MHMKHRGDGHVDLVTAKQRRPGAGMGSGAGQSVEHQLSMGEINSFRVAGGAGGVEQGCHCIFVKLREFEVRRLTSQQRLVLAQHRQ
ncbi:hypothetical protein D3C72_2227840 [compost metagenome]